MAGAAAFAVPAVSTVIGIRVDQSSFRYEPAYGALIPAVFYGSVFLAAAVPAALILTSTLSLPRRIGLTAAVWCLLAIECGIAIVVALTNFH